MKKFTYLLILALALAQEAGAIGFAVSPAELRAVTTAHGTATDVLTVMNNSGRSVRFKAYLKDWTVTRFGADTILGVRPKSLDKRPVLC